MKEALQPSPNLGANESHSSDEEFFSPEQQFESTKN